MKEARPRTMRTRAGRRFGAPARKSFRGARGVTLMELLIAISLVSLLSVSVLMAMRVGLNAMEKTNNRVMDNRRLFGSQRLLDQQIAGMFVTTATCQGQPGAAAAAIPFFQGLPQTMRFVTSYSMREAHRGYPRVVEYQVIPGENGEGVRLVVNEHLYSGPASAGRFCIGPGGPETGPLFHPVQIGPQSFVLADRLADCRFAYLRQGRQPGVREWVSLWAERTFPLAIRIDLRTVEADAARVPLLSMVAPVRVNGIPGLDYVD